MRKVSLAISIILASVILLGIVAVNAQFSISGLTTIASSIGGLNAWNDRGTRDSFYALGRAWVFYANNPDLFYSTQDSGGWTQYNTTMHAGANDYGAYVSATTNGTHAFAVVETDCGNTGCLFFHYGRLNQDGTIAWNSNVSNISQVGSASPFYISLGLSTGNEVFVAYAVEHSPTTYVLWSNDYKSWNSLMVDTTPDENALVRLPQNDMYLTFGSLNGTIFGKLWNAGSWGPTEKITAAYTGGYPRFCCNYPAPIFTFSDSSGNVDVFYQGCIACSQDRYGIEETTRNFSTSTWTIPMTVYNNTLPGELASFVQCTGYPLSVDAWTMTRDPFFGNYLLSTYLSPGFTSSGGCTLPPSYNLVFSSLGESFLGQTFIAVRFPLPAEWHYGDCCGVNGGIIVDPTTSVANGTDVFNYYIKDGTSDYYQQIQAVTVIVASVSTGGGTGGGGRLREM